MAGPTAAQKANADWYISPGGNIWQATGAEADMLRWALGWQGPMTYAQALAVQKTVPGPLRDLNKAVTNAADNAKNTVTGTTSGIADIGDFFHRLSEKQTWVRVGEVALGGLLLYVGIRAMASGSPTVGAGARKSATAPVRKVVKTGVKVAAPEVRLASRTAAKRVAPKTTAKYSKHKARVRRYGSKTPYTPPAPKPPSPPRKTIRVSHIYHHNTSPAAKKPKKVGP